MNPVPYKLGINTGFALNRFPLPEQWLKVVKDLGIKYVQLTADIINPSLGNEIIDNYISRINNLRKEYGIEITSLMTGAFTRVNHFGSPDPLVRKYWLNWFKKFVDIASALGATNVSSHLGILSVEDLNDKEKYDLMLEEVISNWKSLAVYAKEKGITSLSWEPMSVKREFGETLAETEKIDALLSNSAIPINICLDVDHGDICSENPDDYNPYVWLKQFSSRSPFIHIKQSLNDKGGHYPFIKQYNDNGKIIPEKVISTLDCSNASPDTVLLLELSFREREPVESQVINILSESTEYWRKHIEN